MPDGDAREKRVKPAPYISVVATARNDDHGGNLLGRMQAFVSGLLAQCERHRVPCELIMVDWNPVPDRPGLHQALDWSAAGEYCDVRVIQVPAELHQRFRHWKALPLYQMIAKNVGIRRARGEFVLATNIDILFSDELFEILARRGLDRGRMYRVDRWDVMSDVPVEQSIDEQLRWCNSHLLRVNRREGTFPLNPDGSEKIDRLDIVAPKPAVTLGANWFPREMSGAEPFRWVDTNAELRISGAAKNLLLDVEPGPGVDNDLFVLELRDAAGRTMASCAIGGRATVTLPLERGHDRVFLTTDQGGSKVATDLRTLNFRVFRCELTDGPQVLAPEISRGSFVARLGRAARALWKALSAPSEIRIPMSPHALERLHLRQDGSAVSFMLGPLLRRRREGRFLAGAIGVVWEHGWYELERFRGEVFRWMQHTAAVTFFVPRGGARISLLAEAGPAVGFHNATVEVRDERGDVLAKTKLEGRTKVVFAAPESGGAMTLRFNVSGAEKPKTTTADPRKLALRLLRCELEHDGESAPVAIFETSPGSGVWGVRKCKPRAAGLLCVDGAEIAIRGGEELAIEVQAHRGPAQMAIRDPSGATYFEGTVAVKEIIEIPPRDGLYAVLRMATDRPVLVTAVTRIAPGGEATRLALGNPGKAAMHLHTNGCGDFTLMARERWMDLRGYPELDAFSMNIDSVLCWAAHHGGAREEILADPVRIFHIEHASGSGWTPEGERKLYERIAAKGLPWVEFHDVMSWARTMNQFDAPLIFNRENWGLGEETLPEFGSNL